MRAIMMFFGTILLAAAAQASVFVEDLGALPGGRNGVALGINAERAVVGYADTTGGWMAPFLWREDTGMTALPLPQGVVGGAAHGINDRGDIAGECWAEGMGEVKPCLWSAGGSVITLPEATGARYSQALAIGGSGIVVGQSIGVASGRSFARATVWPGPGEPAVLLDGLNGSVADMALGVDGEGRVVGQSSGYGMHDVYFSRAILWSEFGVEDLGVLPGDEYSAATAINDRGEVVGYSFGYGSSGMSRTRAFLWSRAAGMREIAGWTATGDTIATGINAVGEVAGYAYDDRGNPRGFVWSKGGGLRDMGLLPGGRFSMGQAINDHGDAAGLADDHNETVFSRPVMSRAPPPVASAGADISRACGGPMTTVVLDGSGSRFGRGGELTYEWTVNGNRLPPSVSPRAEVELPVGQHLAQLVVREYGRASAPHQIVVNVYDIEPPTSSSAVDPAPNTFGWHNTAVRVNVTATDRCLAVREIRHAVDGGTEAVTMGSSASVLLQGEGVRKVTHRAVDAQGNTEAAVLRSVNIDLTPPIIEAEILPPPGPGGVWSTDVTVYFYARDRLSGVAFVSSPVVVGGPAGTFEVVGLARDRAGNESRLVVTGTRIAGGGEPPEVVLDGSDPGDDGKGGEREPTIWPPNHKMRQVQLSGSIGDHPAPGTQVWAELQSSEPDNAPGIGDGNTVGDTNGHDGYTRKVIVPIQVDAQGRFELDVFLRAERAGGGSGRTYTVTAVARAPSGEEARAVRTYFVPHSMGKR